MDVLENFPKMQDYMFQVAAEKKRYHQILFEAIKGKYNSNMKDMLNMVKWRMDKINEEETTFMSFKRQLKKKKEQSQLDHIKEKTEGLQRFKNIDSPERREGHKSPRLHTETYTPQMLTFIDEESKIVGGSPELN